MDRPAPPALEAYRRTPVFDAASIPAGLLRRHTTKAGVWARIHVLEGELVFRRLEPAVAEVILRPDACDLLVAPEAPHEVEARGPVRFFVEFLRRRRDGNGGSDDDAAPAGSEGAAAAEG